MLERIMLVDDSPGEALLVQQRLHDADFREPVYYIRDPEAALKYLQGEGQYSDRLKYPLPQILLLDLGMPKVDGYQLIRWIRSQPHLSQMVVVVLTGNTDPKRIALAYQLGANSYLAKDGSNEEYAEFVKFFRVYANIAKTIPKLLDDPAQIVLLPPLGRQSTDNSSAASGTA